MSRGGRGAPPDRRPSSPGTSDDEPWQTDNLFRWGPAAHAPPQEPDEPSAVDDEDFDRAEGPAFPGRAVNIVNFRARPATACMRRKAAAKRRKR